MRVLLTGATGLIGRELGKALAARGDTLVCLVRRPRAALLPFPATLVEWDHAREVPAAALAGVDAIVNLAGEPVADGRWTAAKKARITGSRVDGTRRLVHATLLHGGSVKAFVQGSAIGYYGDRGDEVLHGDSAKGTGFFADLVEAWEGELRTLREGRPALRTAVVRTGIVLARQGGALAKMLPMFRASVAGRLGDGRQWMSWIHLDDIVGLFLHALDRPVAGVLEGVAPRPATNRDFTKSLCRALGVLENLPAPAAAIRLLYGEMGGIVLEGARIEPRHAVASGYRFRHASLDGAMADLLRPLRQRTWEKSWELWLPRRPEELWPYFCDERNLEELTPPFLHFHVLGKSTPAMGAGTLIDYRLRLDGVPLRWRTLIEDWEPCVRFVDRQVKGPYALWRHTHRFEPMAGGTLLRDTVRFRLPMGWLGATLAGWKVESWVDRIFAFRAARIDGRFGH